MNDGFALTGRGTPFAVERGSERPLPLDGVERIKSGRGSMAELQKVGQDFEALFLSMLLRSMRKTVEKNELLSGGRGEEVFEGLLDMHLSETSARGNSVLGIADMIIKKYAKSLTTTEDAIGREGVSQPPSSDTIGSSGGSRVFRGSPFSREGAEAWMG